MTLDEALASLALGTARLDRSGSAPVITNEHGDWCSDFVAACSVVSSDNEEFWLYAEGSAAHHEQIGLFTAQVSSDLRGWVAHPDNPVLRVSDSGFDQGGVFDPSIVRFRDKWLLYFSATSGDAHGYAITLAAATHAPPPTDERVGVAASSDGVHFVKHPVPINDARCPFAMVDGSQIRLFYVRPHEGGYSIYTNTSGDGLHFDPATEVLALAPGRAGSWDAKSVTTPKVYRGASQYWMAYAGDDSSLDDPRGIGLATSQDMRTWRRATDSPVLVPGRVNDFDSYSLQSPIFLSVNGRVAMLYAGSDRSVGEGLHSQVGLAWVVKA